MYHFFISSSAIHGNTITITGPDVNHIRMFFACAAGKSSWSAMNARQTTAVPSAKWKQMA